MKQEGGAFKMKCAGLPILGGPGMMAAGAERFAALARWAASAPGKPIYSRWLMRADGNGRSTPAREFAVSVLRDVSQDRRRWRGIGAGPAGRKAFARGGGIYRVEQIRGQASWSYFTIGGRFADAHAICPLMTGLAADPPGTPRGGPIRLMRRHSFFPPPVIFE